MLRNSGSKNANLPQTWMVSYVVDIALSVTHLGKFIRGHFDLVLGILYFAFNYGPDRIEQKQLRDSSCRKRRKNPGARYILSHKG